MALEIIFYVFAVIAVIGALLVVTSTNPVRAVLSKVLTFIAAAGVWMSMQAEYLSLLLIVVYVGAVLVLFLFVIMMLDIKKETENASYVSYWIVSALGLVLFIALLVYGIHMAFYNQYASIEVVSPTHSSIAQLGESMYAHFIYPFELAGFVLLAAMIAAITLTFRGKRKGNKSISPYKQIQVKAKGRIQMVKLDDYQSNLSLNKDKKGDQND
ncbi:MAG: NADH-quinone oxidoreductase subunit J [Gammaproteobacteria bacterium]|nr:MAG: NADH-quinone oxidoreductase subunit J [Gammaproteobacteria bacterium]UTW42508.1 NADH-quinone oxidoreductase subunit J [bacterium SCSIO 12844]